jgi:indolepyruvate ferredoxin oxidoreductase beta subunit
MPWSAIIKVVTVTDVNLNIVIAGVGGQGTVLASKLLATCALEAGAQVRSAETIGMAQRGGSVLGHVRVCQKVGSFDTVETLQSPLVPLGAADVLIGFEPSETVKALEYLRPGGMVVSAIKPLAPPTATLQRLQYDGAEQIAYLQKLAADKVIGKLVLVDGEQATSELGSSRVLNTVLLGATLQALQSPLFSTEALKATMAGVIKPQFLELNVRALEYSQVPA